MVYEGGIRIPSIVSWPNHSSSGTVSDALLTTMDIYPTILEAAEIRVTHLIDEVTFLETLTGGSEPDPNRTLYFSRGEGRLRFGGKTIEAVRKGAWKLLQNTPYTPLELYNLEQDPSESTDLSTTEPEFFVNFPACFVNTFKTAAK